MHTGRIIAYAAIGAVSAYGAFRLYSHYRNRGPAINESAADKLPPPGSIPELPLEPVKPPPNPIVRSRGFSRDTLTLSGDVRGAVPRFAVRDDGMDSGTRILSYIPSMVPVESESESTARYLREHDSSRNRGGVGPGGGYDLFGNPIR